MPGLRRELEHLLNETVDAGVTPFVWLRQFEPGSNSADANRLLDRLRAEPPPGPHQAKSTRSPAPSRTSRAEKLALLNAAERERE